MQIRGREVDFRITRLKDAAAMDSALQKMGRAEKKLNERANSGMANVIEAFQDYIRLIRDFFVDATGTDVLEGCQDVVEARDAYYSFLDEVGRQKNAALAPYSEDRLR